MVNEWSDVDEKRTYHTTILPQKQNDVNKIDIYFFIPHQNLTEVTHKMGHQIDVLLLSEKYKIRKEISKNILKI
jgi:hypothetical protein